MTIIGRVSLLGRGDGECALGLTDRRTDNRSQAMTKSLKSLSLVGAGLGLAVISLAFAEGKGILFPDWSKPTKGTYAAPAEEIGKATKAAQPWSVTTYASAITGKQPL